MKRQRNLMNNNLGNLRLKRNTLEKDLYLLLIKINKKRKKEKKRKINTKIKLKINRSE